MTTSSADAGTLRNDAPRVSIVSHTYVVGANRGKLHALASGEHLDLQVITPEFWCERDPRREIRADAPSSDRYELRQLPIRWLQPALHWYRQGALYQELRRFRPDLVHVEEEPWALAALQVALLKRRMSFKLTLFTWENLHRTLAGPARLIQRVVLNRVDHLIAGNADAASVMQSRGYRGPVTVLPQHGIDLQTFDQRDKDHQARPASPGHRRRYVVGYIGRLVPEKGVDLLIQAFARIPADATLLIVGDGHLADELKRQALALGVADRTTFTGAVPHRAIPEFLQRMDVLALASRTVPNWKEQFGHVLIEAMASGVAVVGSDSGEIPAVIGGAGIVFPEGDVQALSARLSELRDPAARARLAGAGRIRTERLYTNTVLASRYADVFRATAPASAALVNASVSSAKTIALL